MKGGYFRTAMNKRGYLQTGQRTRHDTQGNESFCPGSVQDGAFRKGAYWPVPCFEPEDDTVLDCLTGLTHPTIRR